MDREKVSERERQLWGDDWANVVEMKLRERFVRYDPTLSVELGKRTLLYLASEHGTPDMHVWALLYGRPVVDGREETA